MMKVSHNEMNTALKRAYEGAGYDIGDYEDAAELITWCEMSGLDVIKHLPMPPMVPKGNILPRLVFEGQSSAVIDAGGSDICQYGPLAAHLCYSKASKEGFATVQLTHCIHPILILRSLSLIAQRGVYLTVYWFDSNGAQGASFERDSVFPNYWCVSPKGDSPLNQQSSEVSTITIICSTEPALLADAVTQHTEQKGLSRQEKSATQLSINYEAALEHGIKVDAQQWDALNAAAWPILVPATEQSRMGAGPS